MVRAVHKDPQARTRFIDEFLGTGDVDRIIIEWRSLLRQIVHAGIADWPRWQALQEQARSLLRETESPTVTDLPPIEYQQLKRVDLQLRFRRH